MKPTPKTPELDPITAAEAAVRDSEATVAKLNTELTVAEDAAAKAMARAVELGDSETDASVLADKKRDVARQRHAKALATLETARGKLAALVRERMVLQSEHDRLELPKWKETLLPLHAELIAVDERLDALVLRYCQVVADAQRRWDAAAGRAREIGTMLDIRRPELADARLEGARAARLAREKANHDCLAPWLAAEPGAGQWHLDGATAQEREERLQYEAKARQHDRDSALLAAHVPPVTQGE